jgi:hypothetical protein
MTGNEEPLIYLYSSEHRISTCSKELRDSEQLLKDFQYVSICT